MCRHEPGREQGRARRGLFHQDIAGAEYLTLRSRDLLVLPWCSGDVTLQTVAASQRVFQCTQQLLVSRVQLGGCGKAFEIY